MQVENARAKGGGLTGFALVSVVFSAMAIVVKTLMKVFEGITGSGGGGDAGDVASRPRGMTSGATKAETRRLREEVDRLRQGASGVTGGGGGGGDIQMTVNPMVKAAASSAVGNRATALSTAGAVTVELATVKPRSKVKAVITFADGMKQSIDLLCRIDTQDEVEYYENGGILPYVLRNLAA